MSNAGQFVKGLIYGWGIDDTDYQKERRNYSGNTSTVIWFCATYSRWRNMLKRCLLGREAAYLNIKICDEWRYFSNFKAWYEAQEKPVGDFELDKDLIGGSSGLYSPSTCCLLPVRVNGFLISRKSRKVGASLIGTWYDKGRDNYQAYCESFDNGRVCLGRFKTELEGNIQWQKEKLKSLHDCISWYKSNHKEDEKVVEGLFTLIRKLKENIDKGLPLQELKF